MILFGLLDLKSVTPVKARNSTVFGVMSVARGISSTNALTKVAWSPNEPPLFATKTGSDVHIDSQDEHVKIRLEPQYCR